MLYILLCILVVVIIVSVLKIQWIYWIIPITIVIILNYAYPGVIGEFVLGIAVLGVPAVLLLLNRDKKTYKKDNPQEKKIIEKDMPTDLAGYMAAFKASKKIEETKD